MQSVGHALVVPTAQAPISSQGVNSVFFGVEMVFLKNACTGTHSLRKIWSRVVTPWNEAQAAISEWLVTFSL